MCWDTFYNSLCLYVANVYSNFTGPELQNPENLYRGEEPQKEEFREFDIYFLIENCI